MEVGNLPVKMGIFILALTNTTKRTGMAAMFGLMGACSRADLPKMLSKK